MRYACFTLAVVFFSPVALAGDWLTLPSTYSHDATGRRVNQFAAIDAPVVPIPQSFRTSGYTHTRSSLNYGGSSDNYHRVERWGDPVRPYGEWRFPYRPYSAPYSYWGAPWAGFNLGVGGYYGARGFGGAPGSGFPGRGGRGHVGHDGHDQRPVADGGNGTDPDPKTGHTHRQHGQYPIRGASPLNPYPAGPSTPYPVAPYYDGYYPPYRD